MDPLTNTAVTSLRVEASSAGYRELLRWARQFPERRWAVENAKGLGCHLALWLAARDEVAFAVATVLLFLAAETAGLTSSLIGDRKKLANELYRQRLRCVDTVEAGRGAPESGARGARDTAG